MVCGRTFGSAHEASDSLIDAVTQLVKELRIPLRLRDLGVREEQLPELVSGSRGNSMNGNPRELSDAELQVILEEIW